MTDNIEQKSSDILLPCPNDDMERAWTSACGSFWKRLQKFKSPQAIQKIVRAAFVKGFKAGQNTRATVSPWVPIGDIPDEWKDERRVILVHFGDDARRNGYTRSVPYHEKHGWQYYFNKYHWPATHAMLPPEPPK